MVVCCAALETPGTCILQARDVKLGDTEMSIVSYFEFYVLECHSPRSIQREDHIARVEVFLCEQTSAGAFNAGFLPFHVHFCVS